MTLPEVSQLYRDDSLYGVDEVFPLLATHQSGGMIRCYVILNPIKELWLNLFIGYKWNLDKVQREFVSANELISTPLEYLVPDCKLSRRWMLLSLEALQQLNCKPWTEIPHVRD